MNSGFKKYLLIIASFQSILATVGSLYFSLVLYLPPCDLCWYQRICTYPLTILLFIALLRKDFQIVYYALPLGVLGLVISIYHNLLYFGLLSGSQISCTNGISCTTRYVSWFGFVTIPLLALVAFIIINVCFLLILRLENAKGKSKKNHKR